MAYLSPEDLKKELEKFKTEINLAAYIKDSGYVYLQKESSTHSIALVNSKIKQNRFSKIFVSRLSNGHFVFKDFISGNKGTIVDFVTKYQNKSFGEMRKELRGVLQNKGILVTPTTFDDVQKHQKSAVKIADFNYDSLSFTSYFNERGISNETLFSPAFKNKVVQKQQFSTSGKSYVTPCFPMYEKLSDKVVGLEIKNNVFSGSMAGSQKKAAFWKSNVPLEKPYNIMLVESPIDALSHAQLNPSKTNTLYVATLGTFGDEKINFINDFIAKNKENIKGVVLGFDNDAVGLKYSINSLGKIKLDKSDKSFSVQVNHVMTNNSTGTKFVKSKTLFSEIKSNDKAFLNAFENKLNYAANNLLPLDSQNLSQFKNITKEADKLTVFFYNKTDNLEAFKDVVASFKNEKIVVEKPIHNDFGEDLEKKLNIKREKVKYIGKDGKEKSKSVWIKNKINKKIKLDKDSSLDVSL